MAFAVLLVTGILFSALRWMESLSESKAFYFLGLSVFLAECVHALVTSNIGPKGPYDIVGAALSLAVPVLCISGWVLFFHGAAVALLFGVAEEMSGDKYLEEHCSFDKAEAAERRRDYQAAESLYREAIEGMPKRPEPLVHLGEMLIKIGRHADAAEQFRKALTMVDDRDARARFTFRLAEAQGLAGQKDAAIETLRRFEKAAKDTKYAGYARDRLAKLEGAADS